MKNLQGIMDVCIITNGRSTFPFCFKSAKQQCGVNFDLHVVRDKKWVEANNYCLDICTSPYFLRVDDDMLLHPWAVLFIFESLQVKRRKVASYLFKLWEPWRNGQVNAIKVYKIDCVKEIGGFRPNSVGKIDKTFREDMQKRKFLTIANKSMVAIHSCSTSDEHIHYAKLRGEDRNRKGFKRKSAIFKKYIDRYNLTVEDQYNLAIKGDLTTVNKKRRTDFYTFIQNHEQK